MTSDDNGSFGMGCSVTTGLAFPTLRLIYGFRSWPPDCWAGLAEWSCVSTNPSNTLLRTLYKAFYIYIDYYLKHRVVTIPSTLHNLHIKYYSVASKTKTRSRNSILDLANRGQLVQRSPNGFSADRLGSCSLSIILSVYLTYRRLAMPLAQTPVLPEHFSSWASGRGKMGSKVSNKLTRLQYVGLLLW